MPRNPQPSTSNFFRITLVAVCLASLIWIGDAPWINDEPLLLGYANGFNHQPGAILGIELPFTIAPRGLEGSRGTIYGPVAVWFYQLLLLLPHDMVLLMAVRAALVTVVTAVSLLWLSKSTGLTRAFVPVIMLSPWLWIYSRQMWDNSFGIPLSALMLAAYVSFITSHSRKALCLTVLCAVVLPLLHPMSLALLAPIGLHLLIFNWRWLLKYKISWLTVVAVMAVLASPYFSTFRESFHSRPPTGSSPWRGWVFPLLGGHHLTAMGLQDILGPDWMYRAPMPMPYLMTAAVWITALAYVASWVGIVLAIPRAARLIRRNENATNLDHAATLALGVLVFQMLLDGVQRVYGFPHYYNATWIAYAIFAWLTVDALPKTGFARLAVPTYAVGLAAVLAFLLVRLHVDGGTRSHGYGPSIANQQEVTEQIDRLPIHSVCVSQVPQWTEFVLDSAHFSQMRWPAGEPLDYDVIHLLRPPAIVNKGTPRYVVVRFRNAFPGDARIEAEDFPLSARK